MTAIEAANLGLTFTTLDAQVNAGSTVLNVVSSFGFQVGQEITIDLGLGTQEVHRLNSFGSLVIAAPAKYAHGVGSTVTTKATPVSLEQQTRCNEFAAFCGTATAGWNAKTSCTCSGEQVVVTYAHSPIPHPLGSYCSRWDGTSKPPWCLVSKNVKCGPTDAYLSKYRSSGPCTSKVEPYSQSLVSSWTLYKYLLTCGSLLGLAAICSAGCEFAKMKAIPVRIAPGPWRDPRLWSEEDTISWMRRTPPTEQFMWATQEAGRLVNDDTEDDVRLELYAFYHQAVDGDAPMFPPELTNDSWPRLAHAKWQAVSMTKMSRNQARLEYVKAVCRLYAKGGGAR